MCTSMEQLKVAQAVLVSLKIEGQLCSYWSLQGKNHWGNGERRDWSRKNPGACKEAQKRPRERHTKTSGCVDRRRERYERRRCRRQTSWTERRWTSAPEISEDPNERAKLKRQVMPGSSSEAQAKPKVSPQQVKRPGGLSIASGPPLTKAKPSPTQGVWSVPPRKVREIWKAEPLLSKRCSSRNTSSGEQTQEHIVLLCLVQL